MCRFNLARIQHQVPSRDRECKSQDRQCKSQDKDTEKEQAAQTATESHRAFCRTQDNTQDNVLTLPSSVSTTLHWHNRPGDTNGNYCNRSIAISTTFDCNYYHSLTCSCDFVGGPAQAQVLEA